MQEDKGKGERKCLDIKFVRSNPEVVKENIKKKFQDEKLPLVDEVLELDQRNRDIKGGSRSSSC